MINNFLKIYDMYRPTKMRLSQLNRWSRQVLIMHLCKLFERRILPRIIVQSNSSRITVYILPIRSDPEFFSKMWLRQVPSKIYGKFLDRWLVWSSKICWSKKLQKKAAIHGYIYFFMYRLFSFGYSDFKLQFLYFLC